MAKHHDDRRRAPKPPQNSEQWWRRGVKRLDEAESAIRRLDDPTDTLDFRSNFSACLTAIASVRSLVKHEAPEFFAREEGPWFADGELSKWIVEARNRDIHEQRDILIFRAYTDSITIQPGALPPGAELECRNDGWFLIYDAGKPTERRVPYGEPSARFRTEAALAHRPKTHRGKAIHDNSPSGVLKLAVAHTRQLLHAAASENGAI